MVLWFYGFMQTEIFFILISHFYRKMFKNIFPEIQVYYELR